MVFYSTTRYGRSLNYQNVIKNRHSIFKDLIVSVDLKIIKIYEKYLKYFHYSD